MIWDLVPSTSSSFFLLSHVFGSQAPGILLAVTLMGWNEEREELARCRAGREVRSQLLAAAIAGGSATEPAEGPRARVSAGVLVSVACRRGRQES